jgi:hypothetical protein
MKIKVIEKNAEKIGKALQAVNGNAREHTFNSFDEIVEVCAKADKKLNILPKKIKKGVLIVARSGGSMQKSYRYRRIITQVSLAYSTNGWYLAKIEGSQLWPDQSESISYFFTDVQNEYALKKMKFWF